MNICTTTACMLLLAGPAESTEPTVESKSTKLPASAAEPEASAPATEAPAPKTAEATPAPAGEEAPSTDAPPPTAATGTNSETADPFQGQDATAPAPNEAPPPPPASASVGVAQSTRVYPDRPIKWRVDVSLGVDSTVITDTGYLAFDENDSLLGFDVGARFQHRLGKRLFLGSGIHYSLFQSSRDPYDSLLSTDLVVHEPTIHGRLSVVSVDGVDVFADVGGGPTIVLDTISSPNVDAEQRRSLTGSFSATGGVALYLPKRWLPKKGASRVTGGIETGFGYQYRGTVDFSTDRDLGDDPLPSTTADFGDIGMSGFVWRFGVFLRVM